MDICEFSPSYVRAIAPYQPGKPISELAREYGLDERSILKLASNENPLGISPRAKSALGREFEELARYPDGNAFDLKAALSRRYGVSEQAIVVGNGSNDVLELAAAAFLAPGCSSVYSQHAFVVYPLATLARGAKGIVAPAKEFGHDLDAMLAAIASDTRIVFIANPNNPTGTFLTGAALEAFLARVPPEVLVVLDEAYNDYLPVELRYDSVAWLARHPNLLIARTFSKVYGLAGLRVGFGLCDPEIADLLNRVRQPFNVNSLALAAAVAALDDNEFVAQSYETNGAGMRQLENGFKALRLKWIASAGNFVSVEIPRSEVRPRAGIVYEKLLRSGVIVRPVAGYGMPDHLRVTIGLKQENERFLAALGQALRE
ncbi:MAG: histidinol-phosphate transaminase [Betaproteobacteria bacterium RIFCSPLOWO2_12_FULL_63_13]|nr:MAG: histidinol-phosphate transaminase [Betaproteobacteria bacterium RIFCSPLOWO2_02_FULL_63_19]OGA48565.1 MAG: histidinol-phosphate transaminase [Betaproteobacteria bacterium RIFCSPLOWO2_12_FULL_63_13]